jgi:signal transduction histidine kinase
MVDPTNEANKNGDAPRVSFVADVHIIQVLGEQLIGSEKVGILELIKNAYDAGASFCEVRIEKVSGLPDAPLSDPKIADFPGPVITVIDDGAGMNEYIIRNGWMRPATRLKTSVKEQLKRERLEADKRGTRAEYETLVKTLKKENFGRLPLGEKGVGRFATHRLGRYLELSTKTRDEDIEWVLRIDWEDFNPKDDKPHDLANVRIPLLKRLPERGYGIKDSGTMLRISGGKAGFDWTSDSIREIGQAIALLRSPAKNKGPIGFEARFYAPQLSDEAFEAPTDSVPAPFECTALVDATGVADLEIHFKPPDSLRKPMSPRKWEELAIDLREGNLSYWKNNSSTDEASDGRKAAAKAEPLRAPACGAFTADIKIWIRSKEWIASIEWRQFTDYLQEFGGIGIYRDGLSILPAQNTSRADWLALSKRHIMKGGNISYYQMWGSVDILQEETLDLIDRTSREGMLETLAFGDLQQLVRQIVFSAEHRVKEIRNQYKALVQGERLPKALVNKRVRTAAEILTRVGQNYDFRIDKFHLKDVIGETPDPKQTLGELSTTFSELRNELKELERQSNALLEGAGFGLAIAIALHEIEKTTSNLYHGIQRLSKKGGCDEKSTKELNQLGRIAQSLQNELKRIAPLRVTKLEPIRQFSVRDCILTAVGVFRTTWEGSHVQFESPPKSDDFEIRGSFATCSQVFANIFDNATYWLGTKKEADRRLAVRIDPFNRKVVIADSGPGIAEKMRPHLFEPFFSLKNPPSGLGLYISRYYVNQLKGVLRESLPAERIPSLSGAQFTLVFPAKGGGD